MASTEQREGSAQRIQQLRERLELYNNTIAEAMNVVSGVNGGGQAAAAASKTAAASPPGSATLGDNRPKASSAASANTRPTDSVAFKSATAATKPAAPAPAPRLDRNLSKEFTESSPPRRERVVRQASPLSPLPSQAPNPPSTRHADPASAKASPTAPQPARADSEDYVMEEHVVEEEVTDSDDSDDSTTEDAEADDTTQTRETASSSEEEEDSTDFDFDAEMDEDSDVFNAFMNEVLEDAALRHSLQSVLNGRFHTAASPAQQQQKEGQRCEEAARAARLASPQGQLEERIRVAQERAGAIAKRQDHPHSKHGTVLEADTSTGNTSATSSEKNLAVIARHGSPRTGTTRTVEVVANAEADSHVTFESLEIGYNRLRSVLKSSTKIVNSLGVDEFPAPLPQMERYKTLTERRDNLMREEQALRANPPAGHSLAEVRSSFAVPMDEQARGIITGCQGLLAHFKAVEEKRAAVEAKKQLLAERQDALQERRTARQMIREEITHLQRNIERGNERVKEAEGRYNAAMEQHSAREKDIQGRISEVEALGKKVSWWLRILEERDASLSAKEEKLRRVQQDLLRRSEDLVTFKKLTKRVKQQQPPPPPPRVHRE